MKTLCKKKRGVISIDAGRGGFTLLELVISMTILSLVALLIGSGFRLALDSWEKGEAETEWTQRLRVLSMIFSQQIKSIYPYKVLSDDKKVILFEGDRDSLLFVTTFTGLSYAGFKWVSYSYKDRVLFYKEGRLPDKQFEERVTGDEEIMDADLDEVMFEYYSAEDGEWKEKWDYEEKLPGAVRIKLSNFQPISISIPASNTEPESEEELNEIF